MTELSKPSEKSSNPMNNGSLNERGSNLLGNSNSEQSSGEAKTPGTTERFNVAEGNAAVVVAQLRDTQQAQTTTTTDSEIFVREKSEPNSQLARTNTQPDPERSTSFASSVLDALNSGALPSITEQKRVTQGAESNRSESDKFVDIAPQAASRPSTFASNLFQALQKGEISAVSGTSAVVAGQGNNSGLSGNPAPGGSNAPLATGSEISAASQPLIGSGQAIHQSMGNVGTKADFSSSGFNGTSGVRVGQVQGLVSLGGPTAIGNAELTTPFAAQEVAPDGRLSTPVVQIGQTTDLLQTIAANPALVIGGKTPVPTVAPRPLTTPIQSPEGTLPNPAGKASVSCLTPIVIEGTGTGDITELVFRITRTNPMSVETIEWVLTGVEVTDLVDGASGFSGTAHFAGGQLFADVHVRIHRDVVSEINKLPRLTISDGLYSKVEQGSAQGELIDDDRATILVDDLELDEGSSWAVFPIRLSNPVSYILQFTPRVISGSATQGQDFSTNLEYSTDNGQTWQSAANGVTVPALTTDILVRVPLMPDQVYEGPESFSLETGQITVPGESSSDKVSELLSNWQEGVNATATVYDNGMSSNGTPGDDDRPSLSVHGVEDVSEGSPAVFEVNLSRPLAHPTVLLVQTDLTSADASDLAPYLTVFYFDDPVLRIGIHTLPVVNGTVVLPPGVTQISVRVDTTHDLAYEGPESFGLTVGFVDPALRFADRTGLSAVIRAGASARDVSTVLDDGTGTRYDSVGLPVADDASTTLDESIPIDDRPLTVSSPVVNEASPYAVFTVTGEVGQLVRLALGNTAASSDADATLGTTSNTGDTANAGTSVPLQYFNGTNWVDYTPGSLVEIPPGGSTLLVRTALVDDTTDEGPETFTLTAINTGGTGTIGTATIYDDGRGVVYPGNTTGNPDHQARLNDDRPISVNSIVVNENSPWGVFTVLATAGQSLELAIEIDSDTSTADAGLGIDAGPLLQVLLNNVWVNYTSAVTVPIDGRLMVRTAIHDDSINEGPEFFQLKVTNAVGDPYYGSATILDDGRGVVYSGTDPVPGAILDDDRPVQVNHVVVNENSPWAMFKVTATAGQYLSLGLANDTDPVTANALLGTDTDQLLQVLVNGVWTNYASGVTVPAGGEFFVRIAVNNDTTHEGPEIFHLVVSNQSGNHFIGVGTIVDDGTGTIFTGDVDGISGLPAVDLVTALDDDRPIQITDILVRESSPFAVFTVHASAGQVLGLALQNDNLANTRDANLDDDLNGPLQVYINGNWVNYTASVTVPDNDILLVRIAVTPNTIYEGAEVFQLRVTGPNTNDFYGSATVVDDGTGLHFPDAGPGPDGLPTLDPTATPDDSRPTLSLSGQNVLESAGYAEFEVTLDRVSGRDVFFYPSVRGDTTAAATSGIDYSTLEYYDTSGSQWLSAANGVAISAGSTSVRLRLGIIDDVVDETSEAFIVDIEEITGGVTNTNGISASGMIIDDDPRFRFDGTPVSVIEGETMPFMVRRSSGLGTPVTLDFSIIYESGDTSALPITLSGTVSFSANDTEASIMLATIDDQRTTQDQSFSLTLSSSDPEVFIDESVVVGTVYDNDAVISLESLIATGPDVDGLFTYAVTVQRTGALGFTHKVNWNVTGVGENPINPSLLVLPGLRTLSFAPNADPNASSDTLQFTFQAPAGLMIDGERGFQVGLSEAAETADQVILGRDAARGIVTPLGAAVSIEAVSTGLTEGTGSSTQPQTFRVVLSQAVTNDVVVDWSVRSYASNTVADANAADFGGSFPTGRITIAAGQTSATFQITPFADTTFEPMERFLVDYEVVSGLAGKVGPAALGRIANDDAVVQFAFDSFSALEGSASTGGTLSATLTRSGYLQNTFSARWHVEPLAGVNPADIQAWFASGQNTLSRADGLPSGTIDFVAGQVEASVQLQLVGNANIEADRLFRIVLDNVDQGASLGARSATTATIDDDDARFDLAVATLSHEEGQSGATSIIELVVNRSGDTRQPASVNWTALGSGSQPTNATDLMPGNGSGTLVFAAGASSATLRIAVNADDLVELNETLTVRLTGTSTPHHALGSNTSTVVTLVTDDYSVGFVNTPANLVQSADEDGGSPFAGAVFTFQVERIGDLRQAVTVPWSIPLSGSLTSADFVTTSGVVSFAANSSTATFTVRAIADRVVEGNETFSVHLQPVTGTGASLGTRSSASGTIVNDDVAIVATLSPATSEGSGSPSTYTYTLTRVGDTARQASDVNWSVAGVQVTASGTPVAAALSAGEITSTATGNLTWAAGDTSARTVTVTVANDQVVEADEAFRMSLTSNGSDRSELRASGLAGVVHDDDVQVAIERLSAATVVEGAGGTFRSVSFRVTRTGDLSSSLTVALQAAGVPGATGPSSVIFNPVAPNTASVTLADGSTQTVELRGGTDYIDVTYQLPGNNVLASDATFSVTLATPVATAASGRVVDAASIDAARTTASLTVDDDDDRITVTSSPVGSVSEGNSGNTAITFTLTRDGDTSKATTLNWRILPGTGVGVNASDFASGQETVTVPNNGLPSGQVSFAAGQTSKTITVNVSGDTTIEADESLVLALSNSGNTEFADTPFTVLGDDVGYNVIARATSLDEGNTPGTPRWLSFDVVRAGVSGSTTINWTLAGLTAGDIEAVEVNGVERAVGSLTFSGASSNNTGGTLTFGNGQSGAVIRVRLVQDTAPESDEPVTLSVADQATPNTPLASASTTVLNDDNGLSITANVASVVEGSDTNLQRVRDGAPETQDVSFTVTRTGNLGLTTTVDWAVLAQSGIAAADFDGGVLPTGSLTFTANQTSKTITVKVRKDWVGEANEALTIQLANPSPGTELAVASATTTLTDDDTTVAFSAYTTEATALTHDEGDAGWVDYTFTVSRSASNTSSLNQAQVVGWRVLADEDGHIDPDDFYLSYTDPNDLGVPPTRLLPYGTVTFGANEVSKTVTVKVKSQTFTVPIAQNSSSQQEPNEPFQIELYNPISSGNNASFSASETAGVAWGVITNDDVRIQTTAVITNLPEGRDPAANGGDTSSTQAGIQRWITHSITVERQGDPRQAVSFEWYVDKSGFADNMLTADASGNLLTVTYDGLQGSSAAGLASGVYVAGTRDAQSGLSNGVVSGVLSWAAGDTSAKTLYFTSIGDDLMEGDFRFDVKVRPNPADTTGSARIDEFSKGTDDEEAQDSQAFVAGSTLKIGTIVVQRDETELWISNELYRRYDPATNSFRSDTNESDLMLPSAEQKMRYDVSNGDIKFEGSYLEGTVLFAQAGDDYVARSGTLTFSESQRVHTVTTQLRADTAIEPVETFSFFLNDATRATIVTDQARQTIVDADGTIAGGRRLDIIGSTAIEGIDSHVQFRVSFGQALATESQFKLTVGSETDWADQDSAAGRSSDYLRDVEYSTDKGLTWHTTAPALRYTYETGQAPTQATQVQVQLSFDNSRVGAEGEDANGDYILVPAPRFDAWMDFSDLKAGQNLQVGGRLSAIDFPGIGAPLRDPTVDYYLVVESNGVYIDDNNDGIKGANENTPAFVNWLDFNGNKVFDAGEVLKTGVVSQWVDADGDGFGDTNEIAWTDVPNPFPWSGLNGVYDSGAESIRPLDPAITLAGKKVVVQFNAVPNILLNFNWMDSNDQIQVDLQALAESGKPVGVSNRVSTPIYTGAAINPWEGEWHNALQVQADNNGTSYTTTLDAVKQMAWSGANTRGWLNLSLSGGGNPTTVYKIADFVPPGSNTWQAIPFVNGTSTGIHNQFTFDPPRGAPRGDIWIPVRADASIGSLSMSFGNAAGIGKLEALYKGVAALGNTTDANNIAALEYFQSLLNKPTLDLQGIQDYFSGFDPSNLVPAVKLVRFQVDWDQTGDPTWQINGLDPAMIVAPQTSEWAHLNLLKTVTVAAGSRSADFDIQLGDAAMQWLNEENDELYGGQLVATATGGSVSGPVGVRAPGSAPIVGLSTVEDWNGTITVAPGADDILVRTRLMDDRVDEPVESLALAVKLVSGDPFDGNSATGSISLVDDDAPQITLGTSVLRDPNIGQDYLVKVIDINNRAGDTPNASVRYGGAYVYQSDSLTNNTAAGQDFTVTVRYRGDWEVAAFSEITPHATDPNYEDGANAGGFAPLQHSSPPAFKALTGTAELVNGQPTGFMLAQVNVAAGTYQLMLRSAVQQIGYQPANLFVPDDDDAYAAYSLNDLSDAEKALSADFSATITHVAPTLVARRSTANEADGTLSTEVLAVGGDFANGHATVDYQTVDGGWEDKLFTIVRERSTLEELTVIWEMRTPQPTALPGGAGGSNYVNIYFGHEDIKPAPTSDFRVLDGQWEATVGTDANGDPVKVIRGYATLAPGQKEAQVTVRVRSDDTIEPTKDFIMAVVGEKVGGADSYVSTPQPGPGGDYQVFDGFTLVGNPLGYITNNGVLSQDWALSKYGLVGFGRIQTDDRAFIIKGRVFREAADTPLAENPTIRAENQAQLDALRTASGLPAGYTLHQFQIKLSAEGPGRASVDWQLVVSGIDGEGGFDVGSQTLVNGIPTQATGAHQAEKADFLLYDPSQGAYNSSLGLQWVSSGGSSWVSTPKTVFFEDGQTVRTVVVAIRDDLLREDAEQFSIRLLNPQALEGSSGAVSIDPLQNEAYFLVGDNDGPVVTVAAFQRNGVSGSDSSIGAEGPTTGSVAGFVEGSGTWYAGTTGSGYGLIGQSDVQTTYTGTDNVTADDQRIVLKFTRSEALATASQVQFEMKILSEEQRPAPDMVVEGGANVYKSTDMGRVYYRGIADFAPNSTQTEVVFRVADDFRIEDYPQDLAVEVRIYDADDLPDIYKGLAFDIKARAGWDAAGIGDALNLADWNITQAATPGLMPLTFTIKDDDTRLWLNAFNDGGAVSYSFDDDGDPLSAGLALDYRDARMRAVEGDPMAVLPSGQQAVTTAGDFAVKLVAKGATPGAFTAAWEIVLNGTATQADFNASLLDLTSTYVNASGKTVLVGATPLNFNSPFVNNASTVTVAGLFVPNLTPEADKTFDFVLKTPVTASGKPIFYSPDTAAPHPEMIIKVTLADDDVLYRIDWNGTDSPVDGNGNATVREGDLGSTDTREFVFDINRQMNSNGFKGASTVMWRVVPTNGSDITAADFAGAFFDSQNNQVLPFGQLNFTGQVLHPTTRALVQAPDLIETIRLAVRGDAQVEYGEHFRIELYNPSVGSVNQAAKSVAGVIVNDDTGLRVLDTSRVETDSGDVQVSVTLERVGDLVRALKDDATTTGYDEKVTTVSWTANDQTTDANDRGTGTFTGTEVFNVNNTTHVYGYATESVTLNFNLKGDATVEADETLQVLLSGAQGIDEVIDAAATVTLQNDDARFSVIATPGYEAGNQTVVENVGGTWHFRITRDVATPQGQTVTWSVVAGGGRNTVDATDFGGTLPSGTVTFTGTELYKDITFSNPSPDALPESDEVFLVEVTGFGTGAENDSFVATNGGAKGTLVNDDAALFISDTYAVGQVEGSGADSRQYRFEVVRAGTGLTNTTTVDWALDFAGTGASAGDFTGPTSGTLTFNADGRQTVSVAIDPDSVSETALQDFKIRLSNAQGGLTILGADSNGVLEVTGQLLDDDFTLSVANVTLTEGEGLQQMAFVVTRTGSDALAASVNWSLGFTGQTNPASASDFNATSGSFVVPAGVSSYTFYVPVLGDSQWEADETFTLNLSYNGGAGTASATGTLSNDDAGFSLLPITATSESAGSISFTVKREGDTTGSDSVGWVVSAGAANSVSLTPDADFGASQAQTGTVSFAPGDTEKTVTLTVVNDNVTETAENFTVTLVNPSVGGSLKSAQDAVATGTILNDDQGYGVRVNVARITENAASGGNTATFTIDRYVPNGASAVRWKLEIASGDTAALALQDLLIDGVAATQDAFSGTVLNFANGEASKTVTVSLVGDNRLEGLADLRMVIERNTGDTTSTLVSSSAQIQVQDDDIELSLVPVGSATVLEGAPGTVTAIDFKVTRTGAAIGTTSATWTLAGSGGQPINASDIDRIEVNGVVAGGWTGTVNFADGDVADKTVRVYVKGDLTGEFDESFSLTLSNPGASTSLVTTSAIQTVLNDDPALLLSMATTSVGEGNDGDDRTLSFQVTRSGSTTSTATVRWDVLAAASGASVNVADFGGAYPGGLITFAPGETTKTVTFQTTGDDTLEPNEGLRVQLSYPTGADLIGATSVNATLLNDDATVSIAANAASVLEGDAGQTAMANFTLSASGPTNMNSVVIHWHVVGTGLHPANSQDFVGGVLPSGQTTVNLSSGSGTANLAIQIAGDNIYGPSEQFKVVLDSATALIGSAVGGATITTGSATVTVRDDDLLIGLSQAEAHRVAEGDTSSTAMRFYIDELARSSDAPTLAGISVDYHLTGDIDGNDFSGLSNLAATGVALSLDNYSGRYYIEIPLVGDTVVEGNERFQLHLDNAYRSGSQGGVEIAQAGASVSGQVLNDDFSIALSSPNLIQNEDTGRFVFDVLRSGATDEIVKIRWTLGTPSLQTGELGVSANDFVDPDTGFAYSQAGNAPITGDFEIAAGKSSVRFSIEAVHDLLAETNERFALSVEVIEVGGVAWSANSVQEDHLTGTLINDDPLPSAFDPLPDQAVHLPLNAVV